MSHCSEIFRFITGETLAIKKKDQELGRLNLCATGFFVFSPSRRRRSCCAAAGRAGRRFLLSGVTPESSRHQSSNIHHSIIITSPIRDITTQANARARAVPQELDGMKIRVVGAAAALQHFVSGPRTTDKYFLPAHTCVCVCVRARASSPAGSGENQASDSNQLRDCQVEANIMASDPQALSEKGLYGSLSGFGSTLTWNGAHTCSRKVISTGTHATLDEMHALLHANCLMKRAHTHEVTSPPPLSTHTLWFTRTLTSERRIHPRRAATSLPDCLASRERQVFGFGCWLLFN